MSREMFCVIIMKTHPVVVSPVIRVVDVLGPTNIFGVTIRTKRNIRASRPQSCSYPRITQGKAMLFLTRR
jgi:hypothetical protein